MRREIDQMKGLRQDNINKERKKDKKEREKKKE